MYPVDFFHQQQISQAEHRAMMEPTAYVGKIFYEKFQGSHLSFRILEYLETYFLLIQFEQTSTPPISKYFSVRTLNRSSERSKSTNLN